MKRNTGRWLAVVFTLALAGCATSSTLVEVKPVPAGVASYKSLAIRFEPGVSEDSSGQYSAKFAKALTEYLTKQKLFDRVVTGSEDAGLVLTLKFTRIDRPGGLNSVLMSSTANAEVELDGSFVKGGGETLGSIHLTGNSKNRARTSVSGFGVTSSEDYTQTAIEEAAEKLAEFLASRR